MLLTCLLACSSSSGSPSGAGGDAGASADTSPDVPVGNVVEHGTIVDYFTLKPVAGLTVSDNGVSTTTDANGVWSLTAPKSSTLQLTVTGPKYTKLLFPDEVASGDDANSSIVVMADSSSYNLEQNSLTGFDPAKALVQRSVSRDGGARDHAHRQGEDRGGRARGRQLGARGPDAVARDVVQRGVGGMTTVLIGFTLSPAG